MRVKIFVRGYVYVLNLYLCTDFNTDTTQPPVSVQTASINQSATNNEGAPPPYTESPPPYEGAPNVTPIHPPPPGVMGEPTVVCRVCQQLIFIRGREGQRVVKCSNCHEATVCILFPFLFPFFL